MSFSVAAKKAPTVIGWVEKIRIESVDSTFPAKMDTGAKTSSLGSEVIKLIEPATRSETDFGSVVFSVNDDEGKTRVLKRKIQRWVRIKSKTGGFLRRPVVKMTFCIAGNLISEEVNLSDRTRFIYPVLIGRNMMREGNLAIDPSRTFAVKPTCKPRTSK